MKKIDKKKIKKLVPFFIGTSIIVAGGVILYKAGVKEGIKQGMTAGVSHTLYEVADHLTDPSHFCVYNNSQNIPVVMSGVAITAESDVPKAVTMLESVYKTDGSFTEKTIQSLKDFIFSNKIESLHVH